MLVLLSVVPVGVGLAHFDSESPDDFKASYSFQLDGIKLAFDNARKHSQRRVKRPRGSLYAHVQVWVETHDPGGLVKTDFVYGPVRVSWTRERNGLAAEFPVGKVVYTHGDCTGAEGIHASLRASLLRDTRLIPGRLDAPDGATVPAVERRAIAEVLASGRPIPFARGTADPGAIAIEGAGKGRLDVDMRGKIDYVPTDTPCGATDGGGGTTAPAEPSSVKVENTGFEHPEEQTDPAFYSAVCGTVTWDPPVAGAPASVVLEVQNSDGTWTQVGAERKFTTDASGRKDVRFGINEANRTYRIGVVVGRATGESGGIPVGAGSPPRQTRDCYPP